MKYGQYTTTVSSSMLEYSFISTGPSGDIPKLIQYTYLDEEVCNLGFGVVLPNGEIDDLAITNNGDMEKILATVGNTVYNFTDNYPGHSVVAKGSTLARTRLYRKMITLNYEEIEKDFIVYGNRNNAWEPFIKGVDYQAFLVKRRKSTIFIKESDKDKHEE